MNVLFIITTDDCETVYNAMRLANAGLEKGDDVSVFMLGRGVCFEKCQGSEFNAGKPPWSARQGPGNQRCYEPCWGLSSRRPERSGFSAGNWTNTPFGSCEPAWLMSRRSPKWPPGKSTIPLKRLLHSKTISACGKNWKNSQRFWTAFNFPEKF